MNVFKGHYFITYNDFLITYFLCDDLLSVFYNISNSFIYKKNKLSNNINKKHVIHQKIPRFFVPSYEYLNISKQTKKKWRA